MVNDAVKAALAEDAEDRGFLQAPPGAFYPVRELREGHEATRIIAGRGVRIIPWSVNQSGQDPHERRQRAHRRRAD
jgi:hypothetical protein